MSAKNELRKHVRARRAALAASMPDFAQRIARFASGIPVPGNATVASYWPVAGEADPRALAAVLAAQGHPLALPFVDGTALGFRRWREGDKLVRGRHGNLEPEISRETVTPDIVLVPLVAFDRAGFRLGNGGGYYDRALAELRLRGNVVAIGIAFAEQEVETLPHEPHDQRLDMVVTEKGVRRFAR